MTAFWPNVLLMPIIGGVDQERATALLDTILHEAARTNAAVVIMDVSAVPAFERDTGQFFQRFHDGLALVGARMVLRCSSERRASCGARHRADDGHVRPHPDAA